MRITTIILLLLLLGFYFMPTETKDMINVTGKVVIDTSKQLWNEISTSQEFHNLTNKSKETIKDKILEK